jgi:hypothetical protein
MTYHNGIINCNCEDCLRVIKSSIDYESSINEPITLVSTRLTKDEKIKIKKEAKSLHISTSTYIRLKLFSII